MKKLKKEGSTTTSASVLYDILRKLEADTKVEFGTIDGEVTLIDELFTPDSSRFWDIDDYQPGKSQDSYDKQIVRDWLETTDWDKEPPSPDLPKEIMNKTYERYKSALEKLTSFSNSAFSCVYTCDVHVDAFHEFLRTILFFGVMWSDFDFSYVLKLSLIQI